ncbi:trypsin-like peptidase domain-containing protein [Pseudonocardia sp. TRM90224]|uniref:trypsin-like peptidase domain-containing protein n=1 Tax=Pseudonocardia sp. TRM90224 TaxID=2812678 RepID=UPI001E3A5FEF|nr:trypsin-like peptidase domain-containing protein [Pseudonocardia sp. TRM90224]
MTLRLRGTTAAMTAAGVVVLGAVLAPTAAAAPAPAAFPSAPAPAAGAIHPGVVTDTEGGGACTTNFIFTGGGRTFIGQAAHCAGTGSATETNGCDSGTGGIGTKVTIKAEDGTERAGTLAYSSWVTMQAKGETDPDLCAFNDFALVEIDPADVADVDPTVPYFGGPTGIRTDALKTGEQVYSYGNSPLRLGIGALSPKTGILATEHPSGLSHEVYTLTPGIPGDSGSGFVDSSGRAFGVLSTLNLAPLPVSNGIADLAGALEYANANTDLGVTLVDGEKPFTPTPVGIPLDLLAIPAVPPLPA